MFDRVQNTSTSLFYFIGSHPSLIKFDDIHLLIFINAWRYLLSTFTDWNKRERVGTDKWRYEEANKLTVKW